MPEGCGPVSDSALAGRGDGDEDDVGEGEARGMVDIARSWESGRAGFIVEGGSVGKGDWEMRSEEHSREEDVVVMVGRDRGCGRACACGMGGCERGMSGCI